MPHTVSAQQISALLRTRDDLHAEGFTERGIEREVAAGRLRRIRRGWYAPQDEWKELWPETRHLLHVIAVHRSARGDGPVFAFESAAVIHALPLYRSSPRRVHTMVGTPHHVSNSPDVHRHEGALRPEDVIVRHGMQCTSLERTVLDLARTSSMESAVSATDAALRSFTVDRNSYDKELAEQWCAELLARAARSHLRGIRRARQVIAFADGRAQLPGESVSRLHLWRLGFAAPSLQVEVAAPGGGAYFVDFGLDDVRAFGEFDGEGKYRDEALRREKTIEQIMLEEKQREDWVRGRTHRRFARWGSSHIGTHLTLGRRLASFGITAP